MSIGSITSTGKQNVASGGGVYLVTMRWNVQVASSTTLPMRVYAYVGRMINNANDFVDYIFEKGYRQSDAEYYYPCHGVLGYSTNFVSVVQLMAEKESTIRRLYMQYYTSYLPGTLDSEPSKLISLTCVKL